MDNSKEMQVFLEQLYECCKIPLLRTIHRYVGASEESEDVFHEVFIRIIRNAEMLRNLPRPKMEAYIIMIARGVSIDYLRKKRSGVQIDALDDVVLSFLEKSNKRRPITFDPLGKADLTLMMETIPMEDQILLIGKYYIGLSVNDLAEIVGGTPSGVRSKIHRARKKVFNEWSKSGLNIGDFINES